MMRLITRDKKMKTSGSNTRYSILRQQPAAYVQLSAHQGTHRVGEIHVVRGERGVGEGGGRITAK